MSIPAGWYPDPEREGATRWWDGSAWAPSQDAAPAQGDAGSAWAPSQDEAPAQGDAAAAQADAGSAWAPQQDAGSASGYDFSGGRSATRDDDQQASAPTTDAASMTAAGEGTTSAGQQPTTAYDFSGQDTTGQQSTSGYDFSGASTNATDGGVSVPAASWEQSGAQQYSAPQGAAPQYGQQPYGDQQYGQQQYGAPQDFATQQYGGQGPQKKPKLGLILGLAGGGLLLVIAIIVIIVIIVVNLNNQQQGQPGPDGPQATVPMDVQLEVPMGGEATQEFTITEAGTYEIGATNVGGSGDPVLEVQGDNGFYGEDDDGGDSLNSLLSTQLEPGTYTATITDYSDNDAFTVQFTVTQA